jgi:hypothetical protein
MTDYKRFLDKLAKKTAEKRVAWKPTYEPDTFIASLEGEFTCTVAREGKDVFSFVLRDKQDNNVIELHCVNREEHEHNFEEDDRHFMTVSQLYEAARNIALNIDKKLEDANLLLDKY